MVADLRLRPLRPEDESVGRAAHDELADYNFFLDYDRREPWIQFVERMQRQRRGIDVAPDRVRAAFLIAWLGDQIVGRTSIRFDLNDYLARFGGHIGYAVRPAHRHQDYATEILGQSLIVARSEGVDDVLVTCDVENVGSRLVIERCGGECEDIVHDPREDVDKRRYWVRQRAAPGRATPSRSMGGSSWRIWATMPPIRSTSSLVAGPQIIRQPRARGRRRSR